MNDLSTIIGIIVGTMTMLIIGILIIAQRNLSAGKKELAEKKNYSPKELEGKEGILRLATNEVFELREYFVINKYQAITAYQAALVVSILGFVLFSIGISLNYLEESNSASIVTTSSGAIVEIIAGLFFWLYSKATKQMYIFYRSLLDTERLLIAIELVEKISDDQRNESYRDLITKILEVNVNNSKS